MAGGWIEAGAGRHAEREGEHAGREGEDCEGCSHLSLRPVAATDSGHPLRRCSVLWHQCRTFISIFPSMTWTWTWTCTFTELCLTFHCLLQLYFYAFDIFRESGVPEDQMHYLSIGIGATELITVTLCVSVSFSKTTLTISWNHCWRRITTWPHVQSKLSGKCITITEVWWNNWTQILFAIFAASQSLLIDRAGRKKLMGYGYLMMGVTMSMLTITLSYKLSTLQRHAMHTLCFLQAVM